MNHNNQPLFLIAGPCSIEPLLIATTTNFIKKIWNIGSALDIPTILKLSYDKANRTSLHSYRKPGKTVEDSIDILNGLINGRPSDIRMLVDVHEPSHLELLHLHNIDVIQIPAFLCRQTDLLVEAGRTGKIVNIKKGQFSPATSMEYAIEKALHGGAKEVWITERGSCYGGNGDLVVDYRSLDIIKKMGVPYIFDISHSSQVIGGAQGVSGGSRKHQLTLGRAAVANQIAGVYIEVHPEPANAMSDKETQLPLGELKSLMTNLKELDDFVKKGVN